MHDAAELLPDQSPSYYIAPNDPDYKRFYHNLEFLDDQDADVDDWSYFYLGYEVKSEAEMEKFAEMYRTAYSAGKWLEGDLVVPLGSVEQKESVIPRMNVRLPVIGPDAKRPPLPGKRGANIPVCVERIENNRNAGGHVLFLDGHVEFMEYPGRWPMTEKTVALLNELDRLGPQAGAK